ncbi:MAG: hypothetical protein AAGA38_12100 [Pseudomonadota bacterium]
MVRVLLWALGILVGVSVSVVAFGAFMHFVFHPAKHQWNVHRMDARNDQVWEEGVARIVTVAAELEGSDASETVKSEIVCYEGYYARPWSLKLGATSSGMAPTSLEPEALQAEFPTGATLDISLRSLCNTVFVETSQELPQKFEHNQINIVAPDLSLHCQFNAFRSHSGEFALRTDAGWVGHPSIVAIEERPLKSVSTRSDLGSSETPSVYSGFARRWE